MLSKHFLLSVRHFLFLHGLSELRLNKPFIHLILLRVLRDVSSE